MASATLEIALFYGISEKKKMLRITAYMYAVRPSQHSAHHLHVRDVTPLSHKSRIMYIGRKKKIFTQDTNLTKRKQKLSQYGTYTGESFQPDSVNGETSKIKSRTNTDACNYL